MGGSQGKSYPIQSERYDVLSDQWEDFGPPLPYLLIAPTAFKVKERYIFLIGGLNYNMYYTNKHTIKTEILMLDILKVEEGWKSVKLQGCQLEE